MQQYDLIIIGGGLAGASLAAALKAAPLKIALIDAKLPEASDQRLFALNHSSCQFLKNLGIWPALSTHASAIREVHVSYQNHFGSVRLHCDDIQLPALGYVVPAYHIESALNTALLDTANTTLYRPAKLQTLTQQDHLATVVIETEDGTKTLQAKLIIGADGTNSTVRSQLTIEIDEHDYQQTAIVTRTKLQRPHQHIAHERFTNGGGAIAMLPLSEKECATIWSLDNHKAKMLLGFTDQAFKEELQKEFGYRLGRFESIDARFSYPLRMLRAQKNIIQNVFLLGNSAHTMHPIAAQGFNLALYEVAAIVEYILANTAKQSLFTAQDLAAISANLSRQQAASIGLSHRLTQIFSQKLSILSPIISLSMLGFNLTPGIKKKFIQRMLGRTGRVPSLLLSANE